MVSPLAILFDIRQTDTLTPCTQVQLRPIAGALVSEINEGNRKTGYHTTHFNGNQLASGVYIYLLEFNGSVMMTKKMVMLK